MKKEPKQSMNHKFSFKDAFVILLSLIAFAALIVFVRYSEERTKMMQDQLVQTGFSTEVVNNVSLSEVSSDVTVNEVNQSGWIELYNKRRNVGIELANCYITVNGEKKFTFLPTDVIQPGQFLVVEGLGAFGTTAHDIIGIYDEDGENLMKLMIPSLSPEESYGCLTDGEISYCYLTASKEQTNSESLVITKETLAFSVPGGFYNDSFQLELTETKGRSIYYTLDGTKPTTDSTLYEGPILIENKSGSNMQYATSEGVNYLYSYRPTSITMGMVVQAIAVDGDGNCSDVETQSYFIGLNNASDFKNLPVLSITTPPENLFDYFEGIYVSGSSHEDALARGESGDGAANYLNGWEKEVYVEYFEPQKDKTFEGKMSISILTDISVALPQKSLLLTANGGAFAGSSLRDYYNKDSNRLVLQTNRRDNTYKIREYLAGELLSTTTVGTPDIMPCIVFVNGEYWGGYMLKAEYDEDYINRHYGVDKKNVLIAQDGVVSNNRKYQKEMDELYSYLVTHDMKENTNYAWVKEHLDVRNYLEYFCANVYLANAEYGQDRLVMWRTIKDNGTGYEDGRWRFLMPGLDNTMNNEATGKVATSSINTYLQAGVTQDILLQSLLRNDDFKEQLLTMITNLGENVFNSERVAAAMDGISAQMKKMVEMSYKRFTGYLGESYLKEIDKIESFFEQRQKYIVLYTNEVLSWGGISNVAGDAISE